MGFFDFFKKTDMQQGLREYASTADAILLDVRTPEEYREGHIPGSQNIPLQVIDTVTFDSDTPIFIYCRSGARSRQASARLQAAGYRRVTDLGGILAYKGKVER